MTFDAISQEAPKKTPVNKWMPTKGALEVTRNTRYESKGEVTMTIPYEYALVILGMLGGAPVRKNLNDGSYMYMSNLYDTLLDKMEEINGGATRTPQFSFGREIIKEPSQRPPYMRRDAIRRERA